MSAAALQAWADKMRALRNMNTLAAAEAAPLIDKAVKATAAAGTTPTGEAWVEKKHGGRALEHAAEHLSTAANGETVTVTLSGVDVIHNAGTPRLPKRQILPDAASSGGVPPSIKAAAEEGARRAFAKTMGGG